MDYYQFFIPALNTFSNSHAKKNIQAGYKLKKIIKIQTIDIKDFLKKNIDRYHIDLLSLDTEGFDVQILDTWDWKYRPNVICVETDEKLHIDNILKAHNYNLLTKTRYNSIYIS